MLLRVLEQIFFSRDLPDLIFCYFCIPITALTHGVTVTQQILVLLF